jgi:cystathionine beta-lyase
MSKHTDLVHLGRDPKSQHGVVNPPVYHASTILCPSIAAFKNRAAGDHKYRGVRYGAYGTPTTFALADAVAELEGGAGAVVTSSGLAVVTMALTAFLNSGDHLLMVDSVYTPTRDFCDSVLERLGVETTYYDPLIGEGIAGLIRSNTRVVFTESPGSLTFEVQDIPAIAAAAHQRDALILMDNTWATPLFFQTL